MYKRVLLKLSGESLGGPAGKGLDEESLRKFAGEIAKAVKAGYQIAIVNGGGNIFRGIQGIGKGYDRVTGDRMGMLATVINSLALCSALRSEGIKAEVFTATQMAPLAQLYTRDNAVAVLEEGGVALIAGGTGNPYFSTDSGAALRALEIGADREEIRRTHVPGSAREAPEGDGPDGIRPLRTGARAHRRVRHKHPRRTAESPERRKGRNAGSRVGLRKGNAGPLPFADGLL